MIQTLKRGSFMKKLSIILTFIVSCAITNNIGAGYFYRLVPVAQRTASGMGAIAARAGQSPLAKWGQRHGTSLIAGAGLSGVALIHAHEKYEKERWETIRYYTNKIKEHRNAYWKFWDLAEKAEKKGNTSKANYYRHIKASNDESWIEMYKAKMNELIDNPPSFHEYLQRDLAQKGKSLHEFFLSKPYGLLPFAYRGTQKTLKKTGQSLKDAYSGIKSRLGWKIN